MNKNNNNAKTGIDLRPALKAKFYDDLEYQQLIKDVAKSASKDPATIRRKVRGVGAITIPEMEAFVKHSGLTWAQLTGKTQTA